MVNIDRNNPVFRLFWPRWFSLLAVIILLFMAPPLPAQDVRVSHLSFSETLSESDELDPDFGRFDAYNVTFSQGDQILVQVVAEGFVPAIVLVAPDDSSHLFKTPGGSQRALAYAAEIPLAGEWLLVIRGDSAALGKYKLNAWWVDRASLRLTDDADLCDAVNFVIAHANADFFFMQQQDLITTDNEIPPTVALPGAIESQIVAGVGYVARFYRGNNAKQARNIYSNLAGKLKFCNKDSWTEKFQDWHTPDILSKTREMRYTLHEKEREDYRYAVITTRDLSANPASRYKYEVTLTIGRTK